MNIQEAGEALIKQGFQKEKESPSSDGVFTEYLFFREQEISSNTNVTVFVHLYQMKGAPQGYVEHWHCSKVELREPIRVEDKDEDWVQLNVYGLSLERAADPARLGPIIERLLSAWVAMNRS